MPTPASHSLDELEIALDATIAEMQRLRDESARLRDENAALRVELAEMSERMRLAGDKLRAVAGRLPHAAVAAETDGAEITHENAA
jgi:regulator of replication initiation timing